MSTPPPPRGQRVAGRRAAARPPSRLSGLTGRLGGLSGRTSGSVGRLRARAEHLTLLGCGALVAVALVLMALAVVGVGPTWCDLAGAVLTSTAYVVALAVRTGGRPLVFGGLVLALGVFAATSGNDSVRSGAAVLTATSTAVLAVMATVPAAQVRQALREALLAVGISVIGAFAVVGFRPVVALERFDYVSLVFAFVCGFVLVFRLGAGWHGLGRRGLAVVLVGSAALAISLAYAELLRSYGAAGFIDGVFAGVRWTRANLGAVPRPLLVLVGLPALVWGCHMRARRRQGWWVCVFGVAGTSSIAGGLMNPETSLLEAALIVAYSLPLGLLVGYAVIRLDLMLTGPRGARARRAEELTALRPEPRRFEPLL